MGVLLALAGAVLYGVADFSGGLAARRAPALAVVVCGQAASLLLVVVALLVVPGTPDAASLGWGAAAGLVGAGSLLLFYRCLATGAMSVVAPLTALLAAIVPVAAGLLLGERPSPPALLGVVLALLAVVLVSAEGGRLPRPAQLASRATLGPVVAGFGFGLLFVLLSRAGAGSGAWPLASSRVASLVLLLVVALVARRSVVPRGARASTVLVSGLGDLGANLLFVLAARVALLSVTGVLLALYPAATVLLALVVLRERLARVQVAGLGLAVAGVVLVAVA